MANRTIGQSGEDRAAEYLIGLGFKLLERNFRCRWGEADLVVWDGQEVYLVEVKARTGTGFGLPAEAIGHKKLQRMQRVAQEYEAVRQTRLPVRLGLVTILGDSLPELIVDLPTVD